jgi:hypothetical protein
MNKTPNSDKSRAGVQDTPEQPTLRSSRVRRWLGHLFREWTIESWRPIAPAFAKPQPLKWSDAQVTLAWLGHATVLINFFGVKILTDPVLFPRIGTRLPGFTIGPKRLSAATEFQPANHANEREYKSTRSGGFPTAEILAIRGPTRISPIHTN